MKKILALLLAVMMVLSMAACGAKKNDPSKGGDTAAEIVIKVWSPSEDQAEGNNWLVKMEDAFKAKYPKYANVKFENTTMGEGDAGSAVIQDVSASADVFMFANDQLGKLVKAGGLTKLVGDYEAQVKNDNNQFMINSVTHTDGALYGFPMTNNTWFLYYNKDVFTEEDVKSLDAMIAKDKVYLPFGNGWTAPTLFLACGGTIYGENGLDGEAGVDFGGAKGYAAAKKMVELKNNANVLCGDLDVSKMINGECHATFSGSWVRGELEAKFGDKLGVVMLPKVTIDGEEKQMMAMSGSKVVGVNPNSGKVEGKQAAATAFAAFLASEEAQLARFEMRGMIPAHKNLANNDKVKADPVAVAEMNTIANASALQPALPQMDDFWGPMGNFGGKIVAGDITIESYEIAVDEMVAAMNP
jgi:arabinogalactan oligomer/maltooligosaccharide transport system substrate-binding protein